METTRAGIAIYKINYQSDFILTVVCDVEWGTPFCIKFWTGEPSQAYYVGWTGTEYKNCKVVESDPSKLLVLFDDHHLPVGELKMQIVYHTTIEDFPNAIVDEVTNSMKVMAFIDGKNQKIALDFEGEEAAELQFELPAYANEAQRIANEEQRIANEQARIEAEQQRIDNEQTRQDNEAQRIAQETDRVNEYAELKADAVAATDAANDAATLANQKAQLAADKAALADAAATLANQKAQLAADKAALADAAATLANQKAEYADAQGDYAKEQGDYAKDQGDTALADHRRAESDHETAASDHTQAGNDHTRAESDHSTAADDHTLAASDHSTATDDHTLAASDHSTAAADHTLAASDHSTAANDHTQAGNDHTRAESDHTRAESDHAAVEVYVDSLGSFDISSYHATGGVLAKYADLTAALGTNGANIPEAIRKGGMSVKFVHSSDNKYVQWRLMKNQWSTIVSDWQGIDDEPIAGSENLVESGGAAKYKSYNYTKNDYTNSLVKEIHIEGTKDPNLRYYIRGCQRFRPNAGEKFYFAIQSYDPSTSERSTVCEFLDIDKSGVYAKTKNGFTTYILVILGNKDSNDGYVFGAPYSENLEINDNCWGDLENAPIIKNTIDISDKAVIEANNSKATEQLYTLTDGYWSASGITPSSGFYCISKLISVLPGSIVKVKNFFNSSTPGTSAAAYLYNKNGTAVGSRINIQDFTVQSDGSYTYTIENTRAAFIGLSTQLNSNNGSIKIILPTNIKDAYKEQILSETNIRLKTIEDTLSIDTTKHVDLIMFMGQSNMAGRGITNASHPEAAPAVIDGAGYEFRPISDPTKLYPIAEPFGKNENKSGGIDDGNSKTGSMVSAFVNAYYKTTGKKVVGVSASKGGTRSALWLPSGVLLPDAVQRLTDAITFLTNNGYIIDHKYMVWCQGESDGDNTVSANDYKSNFRTILDTMENAGIEKCFIVRIGKYNGSGSTDYTTIINAQSDLCKDNADIVMASTALASFKDKGLMKDMFHYYQDAYNIVGTYAGRNVGLYRMYGIGKSQYDVMTNSLFFTDKDY